ncbi:MAG: hypothetical protein EBV23_06035 [Flavobacteriia bacterium]|nr:hypothetical protein [Flavobacteriia bacterium]
MAINHSFHFSASKKVLDVFLEHLHNQYFTESDIDEYEEEFQRDDKLVVWFDSYGSLKEFINKVKRAAKKFKVDFDCSLIVGWSLHGDYYIFTYRHETDTLSLFEILPEHRDQVQKIDEEYYEFLGIKYHDSDIPGCLGEVMIRHFYPKTYQPLPD